MSRAPISMLSAAAYSSPNSAKVRSTTIWDAPPTMGPMRGLDQLMSRIFGPASLSCPLGRLDFDVHNPALITVGISADFA